MKNFFLRPHSKIPQEIFDILSEEMNKSRICKIGMAYLTHQTIPELIQKRANLGLMTQILLNSHDLIRPSEIEGISNDLVFPQAIKDIFGIIHSLGDENLVIKILGSNRNRDWVVMHHKFIVFDNLVGFGSLNFTKNGFSYSYENFSFTNEQAIIINFQNEFDALWNIASDLNIDDGHLRNLVCPSCQAEEGIDFESYGLLCTLCGAHFRFT